MAISGETTTSTEETIKAVLHPVKETISEGTQLEVDDRGKAKLGKKLALSGAPKETVENFVKNFEALSGNKVEVDEKTGSLVIDGQITIHSDMLATMQTARVGKLSALCQKMAGSDIEKLNDDDWGKEKSETEKTTRGGGLDASKKERLRLKFHTDMVKPFLKTVGLKDEDMPADLRENGTAALTRVFDLVNDGYRNGDGTLKEIEVKEDMKRGSAFATQVGKSWENEKREYTGRHYVELMQFYTGFVKNKRKSAAWVRQKKMNEKSKEIKEVKGYPDSLTPKLAGLAVTFGDEAASQLEKLFGVENLSDLPEAFVKEANRRLEDEKKSDDYKKDEDFKVNLVNKKLELLARAVTDKKSLRPVKDETLEQRIERYKLLVGDNEKASKAIESAETAVTQSYFDIRATELSRKLREEWSGLIDNAERTAKKEATPEAELKEVLQAYEKLDVLADDPAEVALELENLWDNDTVKVAIQKNANTLTFMSKSAAVYHAEKHFVELIYTGFQEVNELLKEKQPEKAEDDKSKKRAKMNFALGFDPAERLALYVKSARITVGSATEVEIKVQQSGGRTVICVRSGKMKALSSIAQAKAAFMLTYMQTG